MAGSDSPPTISAARNSFGDAILPGGEISAYHASPHTFQEFDPTKLGTGEGETTFGRGLYFAGHPATADAYQRSLRYQHKADIHRYDVKIDVPSDKLLNWDTRVNEQPPHIKEAIENNPKIRAAVDEWAGHHFGDGATLESMGMSRNDLYGENIVHAVEAKYGKDAPAVLKEAGISGMRYLDQGSRGVTGGTATYNYVIYDESKVAITGMNGQPVIHPPSNVEGTGTTSPATPTTPTPPAEDGAPHGLSTASGAAGLAEETGSLAKRFASKLPLVGLAIGGAAAGAALVNGASPVEAASAIPVLGPAVNGNAHEAALQGAEQTGIGFIPAQVGRIVNDAGRAIGRGDPNVAPSMPVEAGRLAVEAGQGIADAITRRIDGPQLPPDYSIIPGNCGNEPAATSQAPTRSTAERDPRVPPVVMRDWDRDGTGRRPTRNLNAQLMPPVATAPPVTPPLTATPGTQASTTVRAPTTTSRSMAPGI